VSLRDALDAKDRRAVAEPHAYFAALPSSLAAQGEALMFLADYLPATFPETYARMGPQIDIIPAFRRVRLDDPLTPPILLAAGLIAEDLLVLQTVDAQWRITAGATASGVPMDERLCMPADMDAARLDALPALSPTALDGLTLIQLPQSGAVLLITPAAG